MDAVSGLERRIEGRGTSEGSWRRSSRLAAVPFVRVEELVPSTRRLVVVAPHPDDEILGVGGLLAMCAPSVRTMLVAVTDGEASHPGSALWSPSELGAVRRRESADGLRILGSTTEAARLGVPDGDVRAHEVELVRELVALLRPTDLVCTTWRWDGHPDHEATGRAAASACRTVGAALLEYPVWMWHWASRDAELPWSRAVRVELSAAAAARKALALQAHVSQLSHDPTTRRGPIVAPWAAERLLRPFELFFQ